MQSFRKEAGDYCKLYVRWKIAFGRALVNSQIALMKRKRVSLVHDSVAGHLMECIQEGRHRDFFEYLSLLIVFDLHHKFVG